MCIDFRKTRKSPLLNLIEKMGTLVFQTSDNVRDHSIAFYGKSLLLTFNIKKQLCFSHLEY